MPDQSPEVRLLADQRNADLAAQQDRELERARALGKKEAQDEQFRAETHAHFKTINGSIADTAEQLRALNQGQREIKEEQARRDLVNTALVAAEDAKGSKHLTRLQSRGIIAMGIIAAISMVTSLAEALGHA